MEGKFAGLQASGTVSDGHFLSVNASPILGRQTLQSISASLRHKFSVPFVYRMRGTD